MTMCNKHQIYAFFLVALVSIACASALGRTSIPGDRTTGTAAYYSDALHGRKTASGEKYNKNKLTAAHRELPFGTIVKVTNMANKQSVKVRINDRGPFGKNSRIIDLSRKAAEQIDMIRAGVIQVQIEIISIPK